MPMIASLLLALQSAPAAPSPATPPAPPPPACASQDHAGFDFWVGEWEVFPAGSDTRIADSRIERVFHGCAIREHWMPLQPGEGGSLTFIDHRSGRWQQVWIGGNGVRVDFEGGIDQGQMVLTGYWDDFGGPGQDALVRMTYSPMTDGSVRQFGEASLDHGRTWQPNFDFTYRRKKGAKQ
jgi:hypothetical protein